MGRYLTLVAVGDAESKKTELLIKYTYNVFNTEFMPTTFINNVQDIIVDHIPYSVYFINAESNDEYQILRQADYEKADCILLCYSIKDRTSFNNISKKWCIEARKVVPQVPVILVGTEIEFRSDKDSDLVSTIEARNLKYLIGAASLVECSVKNCDGIDDVFIEAVRSTYVLQGMVKKLAFRTFPDQYVP